MVNAKKLRKIASQDFADLFIRDITLDTSAPVRSTAMKTTRLISASDTAIGVPMIPPASDVNTASRTPIPPGTPTTTNPASHEVVVMNSMSAMLILAPKAVAVTDVDSDIKIHAGM